MVFDTYHHPNLIVMIEKTRTMPLSSIIIIIILNKNRKTTTS